MKNFISLLFAFFIINFSYAQLDTKSLTTNNGIFIGFYEYLPAEAKANPLKKFPTIIFLHGLGERGNGTTQLPSVLKHGVTKNINAGHDMRFYWNGKWESFIVLAPQLSSNYGSWQNYYVEEMIQYAVKNLPVDEDRIHLTGLSLGGGGTWSYADRTHDNAAKLASIAPVCATYKEMDMSPITDAQLPVWAFHAKDDGTVSIDRTYNAIENIMKLNPEVIPVTTYWDKGGHSIWSRAYDTQYSWSDPNIYEWMLAQNNKLPVNKRPVAIAGADFLAELSTSTTLNGSASTDEDGKILRYVWRKVSGPNGGNIVTPVSTNGITKTTLLEEPGTYVYELKAIDDRAEFTFDLVEVKVSGEFKNIPPKADAGKNINATTNSATLSGTATDDDGTINKTLWRQLQGPSSASIENSGSLKSKISNLKDGNYIFRLEVWDDKGAKSSDDIGVVVKMEAQEGPDPAPVENQKPTINAGPNQAPTQSETQLQGIVNDPSKLITKFQWRQLQGPSPASIENKSAAKTKITGLSNGNYIFRLEAWDKDGKYIKDDIGISVKIKPVSDPGGTNKAPVANAGKNQYLYTSSSTLDGRKSIDEDGSIIKYNWRKLKGPGSFNIESPSGSVTGITSLVAGFYIFRLEVWDNNNVMNFDDIGITVYQSTSQSQAIPQVQSEVQNLAVKAIVPTAEALSINLYPNPATTTLTVEYKGENSGKGNMNIYNASGKLVNSIVINKTSTTIKQNIAISNLAKGMYYLEVVVGNSVKKSMSFIKN